MENISKIFKAIVRGIVDSLKGCLAIVSLDKSIKEKEERGSPSTQQYVKIQKPSATSKQPVKTKQEGKILKRTLQCCGLNGGVFLLSILFFDHGFLPLLQYFLMIIFGHTSEIGQTVWSITHSFLSIIFRTLWILPLMILSKLVNSLWFQDIADSAYRYSCGRPQLLPNIGKLVADVTFSVLIQAFFVIQTCLVNYFPVAPFGYIFALIHNCLLYSLYSFEYKMYNMGWELHKRLNFIESNWPYFIGFGLPLAILTSLTPSYILSGCIFSILFPLLIISANEASPVTNSTPGRLPLFSLVIFLSNTVFHKTLAPMEKNRVNTTKSS
ncbi:etoposide-induced protein 2.4 homolog [Halyomorpha halys]|uniref:etoposide-induced protein 2.4 homolog n=1 Tax=Halyomorpha halys TaxID=286706 RepID=UPI0006D4C6C3|nr:etoposide-induced protein 2.4 homolog [Halyomorpha halys]